MPIGRFRSNAELEGQSESGDRNNVGQKESSKFLKRRGGEGHLIVGEERHCVAVLFYLHVVCLPSGDKAEIELVARTRYLHVLTVDA